MAQVQGVCGSGSVYGIKLFLKSRSYQLLRERLRQEGDVADRLLQVACRELALEEYAETFTEIDPEEVKARARDIEERARARMEAVGV